MNSPLINNPVRHLQKAKGQMRLIISELRENVEKVTEAKTRSLFQHSVEVLAGLLETYEDYEKKSQTALQNKLMESLAKGKAIRTSSRLIQLH